MDTRNEQPEAQEAELRPLEEEELDQATGGAGKRSEVKDSHDKYANP